MANPKYLSELEVTKIENFCKDKEMYEAVRKVLLASIYYNAVPVKGVDFEHKNPAFNFISSTYSGEKSVTNEELGQNLRGLFEGVHLTQSVFDNLKVIKSQEEVVESPYNEAI